jgi:tetratricopeptide (TPR) repeat protein
MRFLPALLLITGIMAASFAQQPLYPWSKLETEADTLLNQQRVYDALKRYTRILEMQSRQRFTGSSLVRYKRAICFYYTGQMNRALDDLNLFIQQNADYPRARLLRAYVLREMGRKEEELADLEKLLKSDPYNIDLIKWYAGSLLEVNRPEQALAVLEPIRPLYTDEEVEFNLALSWYYLNEVEKAFYHLNEAIFINGGYHPAYRYAGMLAIELGRYESALEYIDLALLFESDDPEMFFYKGLVLAETGNIDAACSWLNRAFYRGVDEAAGYLEHLCYAADD